MTDLSKFLRYVLPYASGCSDISAVNALRQAAIDFCRRTNMWAELQDSQPVVADEPEYEVEVPEGAQLSQVLDAYLGQRELAARSVDELRRMYVAPTWSAVKGRPAFFTQLVPETVRLVPTPDATTTDELALRVAYVPTQNASTVPDFLYQSFASDLASGALGYLLAEQGRSYTDPVSGLFHARRFRASMSRATINSNRANIRAPLRARYTRLV